MKNIYIIMGLVTLLLIGGMWWSRSFQATDPGAISRSGIHWHPKLEIYVKGIKQEIPANIGIGVQYAGAPGYDPQMQMAAVHTHDDMPVIHIEIMNGPVRKEDLALGQFLNIWGKDMRSFGSNLRMTVNGKENIEYENYQMRDGDKIELRYE